MKYGLYYKISLINKINNYKFQYYINLNSCIAILKIIERNYNKKICNNKIITYINRIFQNNYKLNNTNSIKIIYDNKILYKINGINKTNKQKEFMNNIIVKITEKYKFIDKTKRKIKNINHKIGKIKKINKNRYTNNLNEYYTNSITKCYNIYKRRIKQLKRSMLNGNYTTFINNSNIKENYNDLNDILEINILEDMIIETKN